MARPLTVLPALIAALVLSTGGAVETLGASPPPPRFDFPVPRSVAPPAAPGSAQAPGTNINVSAGLAGNEAEMSIAVNPTNGENVVIAAHADDFEEINVWSAGARRGL